MRKFLSKVIKMIKKENPRPTCYVSNNEPYPLCKGANNPVEFAENVCITCNLYENMDERAHEEKYDD